MIISEYQNTKIASYEKELQKTSQKEFSIENVIKRTGDRLIVELKGYDNSLNGWISMKDVV